MKSTYLKKSNRVKLDICLLELNNYEDFAGNTKPVVESYVAADPWKNNKTKKMKTLLLVAGLVYLSNGMNVVNSSK